MTLIVSEKESKPPSKNGKISSTSPEIKMEDVLEDAGGYGWFQKLFSFLAIYPQMTAGMIILSPVFTGNEKVNIYCRNETAFRETHGCSINCTEMGADDDYSSIVQEWDLVCSRSWIVDTVTTCQMAGMVIGSVVASIISDTYGRRTGFLMVTFCMGLLGTLPSVAVDPWTYAASRFLAGFGAGGCYVVYLVHLMEFLTPSWRTICGAVSLWPIGELILGLGGYLLPNWRYLTVLSAAPMFLQLLFYPFIQESPRWLLTQNRTDEAYEVLRKVARWNSRPPPAPVHIEALQAAVLKEQEANAKKMNAVQVLRTVLRNKPLLLRLAILCWGNIATTLIYYGVSFSAKNLSGSPSLNLVYMGILDAIRIPAVLVFSNWLGRKRTMIIYMVFADVCLAAILILEFSTTLFSSYPLALTVLALLGRFGALAAWSTLICMTLESFPTTLRSSCLGFVQLAGYIGGGVVAPQCLLLGTILPSLPYMLYCFLMMTSSIFSLFLRDMAGEPLEDYL